MRVDDVEMISVHEVTSAVEAIEFWEDITGLGDKEQFLKHVNHVNEGRTRKDLELDEDCAWDDVDDKELDVTKVRGRRRSVT